MRFKNAALRIDERNALAAKNKSGFQFGYCEAIMDLGLLLDMLEGGHSNGRVNILFALSPYPSCRLRWMP